MLLVWIVIYWVVELFMSDIQNLEILVHNQGFIDDIELAFERTEKRSELFM